MGAKRDIHHLPGHMAVEAMRAGEGIGFTARSLVEADLGAGRLVALFDTSDSANVGYHLVRRPGRMRPSAAAFADWLRREAQTDRARAT